MICLPYRHFHFIMGLILSPVNLTPKFSSQSKVNVSSEFADSPCTWLAGKTRASDSCDEAVLQETS